MKHYPLRYLAGSVPMPSNLWELDSYVQSLRSSLSNGMAERSLPSGTGAVAPYEPLLLSIDPTGIDLSKRSSVKTYLQENPDADYDEVHELILAPYEGNIVHRTITPRSFEAIAIRTAQVLFPGEYRGVMQPWRHYIPLERDFSNLDQVCGYLRDDDFLQELVDRAYEEIIESGKYDMSMLGKGMDAMIDVLRLPTEGNN